MLKDIDPFDNGRAVLGNLIKPIQQLVLDLPEGCFVAGGLIRDMYHGKPFKDIDIVISRRRNHLAFTQAVLKQIFGNNLRFEEYGREEGRIKAGVAGAGYDINNIEKVYKVVGAPVPIDIIVRRSAGTLTPMDVIGEFDLSINQGVLYNHRGYGVRAYYNTSRYVTMSDKFLPNEERINKLKEKYPKLIWLDVNKAIDRIKNPPRRDKKAMEQRLKDIVRLAQKARPVFREVGWDEF